MPREEVARGPRVGPSRVLGRLPRDSPSRTPLREGRADEVIVLLIVNHVGMLSR